MQTETSSASFLEYGSAYRTPIPQKGGSLIRQATTQTARNYVTQLYCFNCDVFLEIHEGWPPCWWPTSPTQNSSRNFP